MHLYSKTRAEIRERQIFKPVSVGTRPVSRAGSGLQWIFPVIRRSKIIKIHDKYCEMCNKNILRADFGALKGSTLDCDSNLMT